MAKPSDTEQQIAARSEAADKLIEKRNYSGAIKAALGTEKPIRVRFGSSQRNLFSELSKKPVNKLVAANTRVIVNAALEPVNQDAVPAKGNPSIHIDTKDENQEYQTLFKQDKQGQVLANETYPSAQKNSVATAQKTETTAESVATAEPVDQVQNSVIASSEPGSLATVTPAELALADKETKLEAQVQALVGTLQVVSADAQKIATALRHVERTAKQPSPSAKWAFSKVRAGLNTFKEKAAQLKDKAEDIAANGAKSLEKWKGRAGEAQAKVAIFKTNAAQKAETLKGKAEIAQAKISHGVATIRDEIKDIKASTVRDFNTIKGLVEDAQETLATLKKDGGEKLASAKIMLEHKALGTVETATNWVNEQTTAVRNQLVAKAAMNAVARGDQRIRNDSYDVDGHTVSRTNEPGQYKLTDNNGQAVMLFSANEAGKITGIQQKSDYDFVSVKAAMNAEVVRTTLKPMEEAHDKGSAAVAQMARRYLEYTATLDSSGPTTDPNTRASHKGKTYTFTLSKSNTLTIEHKTRGVVLRQESEKPAVSNLSGKDLAALEPAVQSHQQSQQQTEDKSMAAASR